MTERLDALIARKNGDKTYWTKIGAAFRTKDGAGWQVLFDALPLTDAEGRCAVLLKPPMPRDGERRGGYEPGADDSVPF